MANETTPENPPAPKIKDFGITSAFVVIYDDETANVIALKPGEEQIVELTKHWQGEMQKQEDDQ